jgi:hypothetical protein
VVGILAIVQNQQRHIVMSAAAPSINYLRRALTSHTCLVQVLHHLPAGTHQA